MPTLDWIGKEAVVNHHNEVPYRLLRCHDDLSAGQDSGNLLVEGDNLEALKALLPYYAGKVQCIYIDPPYNTGEQTWTYNDAVTSPQINAWLGKVVGDEGEDLSRHDKWLCMMYPRLTLLLQFLRPDGFLLVSLDDTEFAHFQLLMRDLSQIRYTATLIWKSRRNLDNRSLHNISVDHEYVVVFRKGNAAFRGTPKDMSKYANPDSDPRGPWMSDNLVGLATKERRPNLHYDLVDPETGNVYPCADKGWRYRRDVMARKIAEGRVLWPPKKTGRPRHKKFAAELRSDFAGFSSFVQCGNTNEGTEEVSRIMGREQFIFPKPRSLIQSLLQQTTSGNDIIMDSFAGTGTTGHATLALNAEDGGNRRFILVEMEPQIARNITAERLRRVIEGHSFHGTERTLLFAKRLTVTALRHFQRILDDLGALKEQHGADYRRFETRIEDNKIVLYGVRSVEGFTEGLGDGFRYCTLGDTLFGAEGRIAETVTFDDLARYVFLVEAGAPLPGDIDGRSPLIGVSRDIGVYLLYNGILKDKRPQGGNVLTRAILNNLPPHDGPKVVYGTACRLSSETLRRAGVTFRQIPYQIKVM